MKKIVSIFVIAIFIVSAFGAVANPKEETNNLLTLENMFNVSEPIILDRENYNSVQIEESTSNLLETGKPVLPKISKTYELPIGSEIKGVNVVFSKDYSGHDWVVQMQKKAAWASRVSIYDVKKCCE